MDADLVFKDKIVIRDGELTVHQESGFGDVDGDGDCDAADKTFADDFCDGGLWFDPCKVMDLDFDGDWDASDLTLWNALPSGPLQGPGKTSTGVEQPFAHQGLLFDAELASYQNRARQYDPNKRRFVQRNPLASEINYNGGYVDGLNLYGAYEQNPLFFWDPLGTDTCEDDANYRHGTCHGYCQSDLSNWIGDCSVYLKHCKLGAINARAVCGAVCAGIALCTSPAGGLTCMAICMKAYATKISNCSLYYGCCIDDAKLSADRCNKRCADTFNDDLNRCEGDDDGGFGSRYLSASL